RVRAERIRGRGRTVITVVHAGPPYLDSYRMWWVMNAARCCTASLVPKWVCRRSATSVACRASMACASQLLRALARCRPRWRTWRDPFSVINHQPPYQRHVGIDTWQPIAAPPSAHRVANHPLHLASKYCWLTADPMRGHLGALSSACPVTTRGFSTRSWPYTA